MEINDRWLKLVMDSVIRIRSRSVFDFVMEIEFSEGEIVLRH